MPALLRKIEGTVISKQCRRTFGGVNRVEQDAFKFGKHLDRLNAAFGRDAVYFTNIISISDHIFAIHNAAAAQFVGGCTGHSEDVGLPRVILAFGIGGLTMEGFWAAIFATMRTMGYLGLLLSAGVLFGFVLTYYRVPQQFTELFLSFDLSPYTVLMIVLIFYIILGMFLEPVSMTFITLPTIYPLMDAAGFNMIWSWVVYTRSKSETLVPITVPPEV